MNESDYFFLKQLPFFGFLFIGLFIASMLVFKYRARTSLAIYYIGFVALALGLGEVWFWFAETRERASTFIEGSYTNNHMSPDKDLGFALTAGPRRVESIKRSRDGKIIYNATYGIDARGLRMVTPIGTGPAAFFFGDSFTFGEGVDDTDTLPSQFAKLSHASAFNFGVHGYGPHQFLRMLEVAKPEQLGIREEGAFVVFSLLPTHVDRAAGRAMWDPDGPYYGLSSAGVEFSGPFKRGIAERIGNKSYIYKLIHPLLAETQNRMRVLAILEQARKIIKARYGTRMLVVIWDNRAHERHELARAAWMRTALTEASIANLSVSQMTPPLRDPTYYIPGDGHPNAAAYAALAKAILDRCNEIKCFEKNN